MNLYQRITALIVIITFGGLVTSPAAAAIRTELEDGDAPVTAPAVTDERERLAQAVVEVRDELRKLAGKPDPMNRVASLQERRDARIRLKTLRADLRELDRQTREEFRKTRELIDARGLPPVIVERHAKALAEYDARATALFDDLAVIETADETAAIERAQEAAGRLEALELERAHQPFDPNVLPNRSLQPPENNEPKLTPEAFLSAGDVADYSMALVANEGFDLSGLTDANNAAYLAATPEVVISEAIETKAAELGHDPIAIYNFVRNNVEWQPYWGAVQNADLTLSAQRGTAMDIASLTIALLRASGIPARYAHGTIELDEAKFRNWIGGFEYIDAAIHFAASGGIPIVGVKSGGETKRVRMQHIWVEAALDFAPSRGAINRAADTWVPMDPSFKQYEFLQGLDPVAIAGLDPDALAQRILDAGMASEQEGWVTGVDPAVLQSAQESAGQELLDYIDANLPDVTVSDILGGRHIVEKETLLFAGELPYQVLITGTRFASLPDSLRQHMLFGLAGGHQVRFRWADINNARITFSFRPATQVDEQALTAFLPQGEVTDISQLPGSIPTYLINLVPELRVGDDVVLTGDPIRPGEEVAFTYTPHLASGRIGASSPYSVIAGSYLVVAAIAGNVSPTQAAAVREELATALDASGGGSVTREAILGNLFHAGMLDYYDQYVALSFFSGVRQGGQHYLAGGLGTFGFEPDVHTVMGLPMAIRSGGAVMNLPILRTIGHDSEGGGARAQFSLEIGALSSALESLVPERLFAAVMPNASAASTVRVVHAARNQGQKIFRISDATIDAALPLLSHSAQVISEIRSAVAAGRQVITHQSALTIGGWHGSGYLIYDPITGDGAYKVSGGENGGVLVLAAFLSFFLVLAVFLILVPVSIPLLLLIGTQLIIGAYGYADFIHTMTGHHRAGDITDDQLTGSVGLVSVLIILANIFWLRGLAAGANGSVSSSSEALELKSWGWIMDAYAGLTALIARFVGDAS